MPWTTTEKNGMLDSRTVNQLSLHNGDPGAAGANNEISGGGYARQAATFNAAAGGERALDTDVSFSGTALQAVTHVGFWDSAGPTFRGSAAITGDAAFNAAGEYTIVSGTTVLSLTDA